MIIVTFLLKCVREILFYFIFLLLSLISSPHLMSVGMFSVNFFPLCYATHRRCRLSFGVLKCIYVYTRVWIINDIISACRLCPRAQQHHSNNNSSRREQSCKVNAGKKYFFITRWHSRSRIFMRMCKY